MRFERRVWTVVIGACFSLMSTAIWAANIYVSPNGKSGPGTGTKSKPASLQHALDMANGNGQNDTLFLQTGTYAAAATFTYGAGNDGKSVTLSGGWNKQFSSQKKDRTLTVLDGGGTTRVLSITNDVNQTAYFTMQNLTIQNGSVSTVGGAGLLVTNTNGILRLTIRNCLFQYNSTPLGINILGGAIETSAPMEVYDTSFLSNAANGGGAIYIAGLPTTPDWAHNVLIDGCFFEANLTTGLQGGVHIYSYDVNLTIRNSSFLGKADKSSSIGSGIASGNFSYLDISNSIFSGNVTDYWSGAIQFYNSYGATITDTLFIDNVAGSSGDGTGGAIDLYYAAPPGNPVTLINCTFVNNRSIGYQGYGDALTNRGHPLAVINSIFWGNDGGSGLYNDGAASAAISYSDIQGGIPSGFIDGGNNINQDPLFESDGYHLSSTSPCIDKGSNDDVAGITDIDGDVRILDGGVGAVVDLGADEYSPPFTTVSILAPTAGEIIPSNSEYSVGWGAPDTAVSFKVSYSTDNGLTWKPIGSTTGARAILWNVPLVTKNLTKCLMKVTGYDAAGKKVGTGKSGLFTMEILKIIHPALGEIIHPSTNPSTPYTVEWSTSNPDAILFQLYYSFNNGTTWNLVPGTKNKIPGFTFDTPIPPPDSGNMQCSLKIVGYNTQGKKVAEGISGRFFLEVLKVTDPNGGGSVQGGQAGSISWHLWEPVDPVQTVLLYYTLDGGVTWKKIASLSGSYTAQETLHTYNFPSWPTVTKDTKCKVKVVIKDDRGFTMGTDVSDDFFTINP